jgi:heme exporter protein B
MMNSILSVVKKDIKSELRNRYSINSLLLFVLVTITIILFSIGLEDVSPSVLAGMFWIVMFFAASSGLSRTFVSEEERGTSLSLKLVASGGTIYFGKLLFNIILMLFLTIFICIFYLFFMNHFVINNYLIFILTLLFGSIGLASASTIIAAIISKASSKGTLYPVLSFPILLPLLIIVIGLTKSAQDGEAFSMVYNQFLLIISYSGILITVSYLLFDFIWKD